MKPNVLNRDPFPSIDLVSLGANQISAKVKAIPKRSTSKMVNKIEPFEIESNF